MRAEGVGACRIHRASTVISGALVDITADTWSANAGKPGLDSAGGRATVAVDGVAIVTLFTGFDDTIAAYSSTDNSLIDLAIAVIVQAIANFRGRLVGLNADHHAIDAGCGAGCTDTQQAGVTR